MPPDARRRGTLAAAASPRQHQSPNNGRKSPIMPDNSEASLQQSGDHLQYARLLRQVDLFAGLDRVALARLAAHLQPLSYESGSIIFRQGDIGDAFYLVAGG